MKNNKMGNETIISADDAASSTIDNGDWNKLNGHRSIVIWLTGLSGSGKSTLASGIVSRLYRKNVRTVLLDGDIIRQGLNKDLGFTKAERSENLRRITEVIRLMKGSGLVVVAAFISPFRNDRDRLRALFTTDFIEIFVDAPLPVCEKRDPKGLYRKARKEKTKDFTGLSSPYETPDNPEIHVRTATETIDDSLENIMSCITPALFIN